ncbi:hypothetical protein MHL86_10305 [Brevibacillus laterosporus]|nr:hypothetical protein [Brevibacillus laterosporus]
MMILFQENGKYTIDFKQLTRSTGVGSMPEPPHECIYTHVAIDLED